MRQSAGLSPPLMVHMPTSLLLRPAISPHLCTLSRSVIGLPQGLGYGWGQLFEGLGAVTNLVFLFF